ncbi:MAG TPA: GNAT family N-acetyltransferase [Gemmatimonas sp.]|uniref:GNAT family N-acetyltransferase n=1 Tax=Gemmatimonas sp. TaxID=1962908 RepID=UPI002EDB48D9
MALSIERLTTRELNADQRTAMLTLCAEAYEEDLSAYLTDIGEGEHLLGWQDDVLVSHLMWVERLLHRDRRSASLRPPFRSAYIELVATAPAQQGRGHASALMRAAAVAISDFDIGALSPSDEQFYARLGWETWRGPLFVRPQPDEAGQAVWEATPDEEIMILRLPATPSLLDLRAPLAVDWRPGEVW